MTDTGKLIRAALLAVALSSPGAALAQFSGSSVKIGVLTDLTSIYSDIAGKGSVVAARLAVEDMGGKVGSVPVELVTADHLAKVDVGSSLARRMYDVDGVDVLVDISNSAVSLAVQEVARNAGKAVLHVGSAHADLYGKSCSQTGVLWLYDTYALAQGLAKAIVAEGGDTWFFVTADYAFGNSMQAEVTNVVNAAGGKVVGSVRHPVGTADQSSFLLQAQSSKAKVIGFANVGADTANSIKQAGEFGIASGGQRLAALIFYDQTAKAIGPQLAQGLQFLTGYYWDRDEASRAFAKRFAAEMDGAMPSHIHAGVYSATRHYLRALAKAGTDDGKAAVAAMKTIPVDDFYAEGAMVRSDGRLMKDLFLAEVKTPSEVRSPWDLFRIKSRVKAADIVRPMDQGGCTMASN